MSVNIRPARHEDVEQIRPWTTDTFPWGDYLPDRLPTWIDQPGSIAIVCTDEDDVPIAVSHAQMLSPTEGWLEGARVRPDHKRRGLGNAMNKYGVSWAKEQGARVVRLAIERPNIAPQRQVEKLGYRRTSRWLANMYVVDEAVRLPGQPEMKPANPADIDAAWLSWSAGDLSQAGRGLVPAYGWQWRRLTPDDLRQAAANGDLYQSPLGWAIVDRAGEYTIRVSWASMSPDNGPGMLEGLLGLAESSGVPRVLILLPKLPWVEEALIRAGGDPDEELLYTLAV